MKSFYTFLIAFIFTIASFAQTTIYLEEFSVNARGYNQNTDEINLTGVDWTIDITNVPLDDQLNTRFRFRTISNSGSPLFQARRVVGGADWISPVIDISNDTDVSFTIDISEGNGNLEVADVVTTTYSIDGGPFVVANTNGVISGTIASVTEVSQSTLNGATLQIKVNFISDNNNDRHQMDNVRVQGSPKTYTFTSGSWSPTDPNGNASNENRGEILVTSGDAVISADTNINTVVVNPGASLTVDSGFTLTTGDAINGLTLESSSSSFSSLINNGTISGTINYERFVNGLGSGLPGTGGNDLISAPVGTDPSIDFSDLLGFGNNSTIIASSGTLYAFAPFNNATGNYEVEDTSLPSPVTIVPGQGYRVATTSGDNVTFSGPFSSGTISIPVSTGASSQWNLIGNPYPSYINALDFLSANAGVLDDSVLDPAAAAIYAYNAGTYSGSDDTIGNFTIINNNTNSGLNIAPGQGFYVASDATGGNINFTPVMRTTSGSDDFIEGRSSQSMQNYKFVLELVSATNARTSFYFNDNSSRGLDIGYDAAIFGGNANNASIYSHLVEDNMGRAMAMQSLGVSDFEDIVVPLGVNSNQGNQVRFSINQSTLPDTINVYLEDQVRNTMTLLNNNDYVFTPTTDLSGTGRFFLHFNESTLSTERTDLEALNIYTNKTTKTIVISGQLLEATTANLYDLQGLKVNVTQLETAKTNQIIDTSNLSTGVYVIQLTDGISSKSQKVIIR